MNSVFGNLFLRIFGLLLILSLAACHRTNPSIEEPTLPCKVQGACDQTINKYLKRFNRKGIKAITIGQDYLISIPASALFPEQSPQLTWGSYGLLNEVAIFLKQFRKVAINVTAYSSKCISVQRERALTLARARNVGDYLYSQGIDSRFIFTQGLGSEKPIAELMEGGDKSPNARIEITFRRAVA